MSRIMLSVGIEIDGEFNRFVLEASPEAMKYRCAKPGARPIDCSGRNVVTPTEAFAKLDESFVATVVDEQDVHFPSKSRHGMTTLSDLLHHGINRAEFAHCCEQDHAFSHSRATLHQGTLFLRKQRVCKDVSTVDLEAFRGDIRSATVTCIHIKSRVVGDKRFSCQPRRLHS